MSYVNFILRSYFQNKNSNIRKIVNEPLPCQKKCFHYLVKAARYTMWGKKYNYRQLTSYQQFQETVPLNTYESLYPYIERMIKGERNVLWRGKVHMFSKSSGTSGSKSKFIPVSLESLIECNYKGGKDTLSLYAQNRPDTRLFSGKTLSLSGSMRPSELNPKAICGDISALLIKYIPDWANHLRTPPKKIALIDGWNEKLELFAQHTKNENITGLAGVPSWILIILKRILEIEGKETLDSIWPNLELFMHGGVNFTPYLPQYKEITHTDKLLFWQIYNASEGYFATQDRAYADDMLLLLNNGVFFEFIPFNDFYNHDFHAIPLDEVKENVNYAIVISTNAGLWRYIIGDVIQFTSLNPYRIIIAGRTTHFINAFGEELIVDNVEKALQITCEKTQSLVSEYTAAPVYLDNHKKACHEWLIEFETPPSDLQIFTDILDAELMKINSDYEVKRSFDLLLHKPIIHQVPQGTFIQWMASKGKLGGQFKVPRLSNNRLIMDEIMKMLE